MSEDQASTSTATSSTRKTRQEPTRTFMFDIRDLDDIKLYEDLEHVAVPVA